MNPSSLCLIIIFIITITITINGMCNQIVTSEN